MNFKNDENLPNVQFEGARTHFVRPPGGEHAYSAAPVVRSTDAGLMMTAALDELRANRLVHKLAHLPTSSATPRSALEDGAAPDPKAGRRRRLTLAVFAARIVLLAAAVGATALTGWAVQHSSIKPAQGSSL